MSEMIRTGLGVRSERALLVGVILPDSRVDMHDPVGELRSLAKTAGANVSDEMVAKRQKPHPGLYVGTGKADEIARRAEANDIDTVIFDNDLTPAQIRDLEDIIARKVLDRSELILDIFATHARTAASRAQVELAQLEYTYPRLRHMWTHLERVAGGAATAAGAVGGIGTRGPGEQQLEIDRRLVQRRITKLKRKIAEIDRRKMRQVSGRGDVFCTCLVGYTNAGKSTLMNRLTGAGVQVADQLFATLDTRTRKWQINGQEVLLSDTVGFIRDLPHHLVASFRATLEEAIHADLLLHVADASHDRVDDEVAVVRRVLDELGCDRQKQLLVLNKTDRIKDPAARTVLANRYPEAIFISAATGDGVDELAEAVATRGAGDRVRLELRADCRNGKLMQYIEQHADVHSRDYSDATAIIRADMPSRYADGLANFAQDVEVSRL